jgi:Caspase domain
MPRYNLTPAALLVAGVLCASVANVRAQSPDVPQSGETYEAAVAKAQADCAALWADHNLDPLRDKVPLGEDNKPTAAMLANPERLRAEDKPVADLAVKALGQCRKAWEPGVAMRPPAVNLMMAGVHRDQDALIPDLYSGKISWGDFNAALDRLNGEFQQAVSSTQSPPALPAAEEKPAKVSDPPADQNAPAVSASGDVRLALVIGDSNYSNLPKLGNPANDARAIAELLQKIGFTVRLVPDASEANLRREVRKFASDSAKADIALVFFCGPWRAGRRAELRAARRYGYSTDGGRHRVYGPEG